MSLFINFQELKLKKTMNQYLVFPGHLEIKIKPNIYSPIYSCDPISLQKHWNKVVSNQRGVGDIVNDKKNYRFRCVQYSKVFNFPDIVDVAFYNFETGLSTIAIFSRSKYGYYDFNVNKNRINLWLENLNEYVTIHQ